ncbi:hypothetical protein V1477_001321 [Vespula maculifrons]|uniref:Uncharacterized protein n=1 Tax=Vespula maculifrons TaxID=7453 RepID=A0ABD2CZK2_VESMC
MSPRYKFSRISRDKTEHRIRISVSGSFFVSQNRDVRRLKDQQLLPLCLLSNLYNHIYIFKNSGATVQSVEYFQCLLAFTGFISSIHLFDSEI